MHPDAREPALPALIYDGTCAFCTSCVLFLDARLRRRGRAVRFLPYQLLDDELSSAYRVSRGAARRTVWWLDEHGRARSGGRAIAAALAALGGVWRVVAAVLDARALRPLVDAGYRLVARVRHRLPGGRPALP